MTYLNPKGSRPPRHRRWPAATLAALAVAGTNPAAAAATASAFTGGDPGEGLDLEGNFIYAVNIGTNGAAGQVGDADFTADAVAGVSVVTGFEIPDWHAPEYGETDNDNRLEVVMGSIRWSSAAAEPPAVTVDLTGLVPGARYKLQILFAEQCCANRGFDIYLGGELLLDEFNPSVIQGGAGVTSAGAVVTHEFEAVETGLTLVLDGRTVTTAAFADHNAILSGLTLEETRPRILSDSDDDGDGMDDGWELFYFATTDRDGSGDLDGDGLTDAAEFAAGSLPDNADSDGDGLTDGSEVQEHASDPTLSDTDGDGLGDAEEVEFHLSSPSDPDSDDDGDTDLVEVLAGTDPNDPGERANAAVLIVDNGPAESWETPGAWSDGIAPAAGRRYFVDARLAATVRSPASGAPVFAGDALELHGPGADLVLAHANGTAARVDRLLLDGATVRLGAGVSALGLDGAAEIGPGGAVVEIPAGATVTLGAALSGAGDLVVLQTGAAGGQAGLELTGTGGGFTGPITVDGAYLHAVGEGSLGGGDITLNSARFDVDYNLVSPTATLTVSGDDLIFVLDQTLIVGALKFIDLSLPEGTYDWAALDNLGVGQNFVDGGGAIIVGGDTDADGLPDAWEEEQFGNLEEGGAGDPDGDGLSNLGEFLAGSDPLDPDSDDDTLNDGDEVAAGADPLRPDTDGDGLGDADEVNLHATDPALADTDGDGLDDRSEVADLATDPNAADSDGDGFDDGAEVEAGTDPNDRFNFPLTIPTETTVGAFSGGDPGEGLDLEGEFVYAVNVAATLVDPPAAGDADFTPDNAPGVSVRAVNNILAWHLPEYGDSPADDALEVVMTSIRWTVGALPEPDNAVRIDLASLVPGASYQLQLLFAENCCITRGFDVFIEGELAADEFFPAAVQGGALPNTAAGAVITHRYTAGDDTLNIVLDGSASSTAGDVNAILSGFTLELLSSGEDSDRDGLPDNWENLHFGDLSRDPGGDLDGDGLTEVEEFALGTLPTTADTDGDGLGDGDEQNVHRTDPTRPDTDGDFLDDGDEVALHGSDPLVVDTDRDGFSDGREVLLGTDPTLGLDRPENLALGRPVPFTSSVHPVNNFEPDGQNTTDGSTTDIFASSYWLAADGVVDGVTEAYFILDLGEPTPVGRILLRNTHNENHNDRGTLDFRIEAAGALNLNGTDLDPAAAEVVLQGTLQAVPGQVEIRGQLFDPANGLRAGSFRYLKFVAETAFNNHAGLNEIEVYAPLADGGDRDSDGDGLTDAEEAALGTDPDDPTARFDARVTAFDPGAGGGFSLAWPAAPGRTFTIRFKTDLAAPAWTVLATGLAAGDGEATAAFTDPAAGTRPAGFYQVLLEE